jgi:RNA methyltransferase, TrmH family
VPVKPATPGILSTIGDAVTSQGWLALAQIPEHPYVYSDPPERLLILDGVQDPGNVGTLLRTADAVGAGVIMLSGTADPLSPKVVRASAGAIVRVPWVSGEREGLIEWLREKRRPVVVLDSNGGEMLYRVNLPLPLALVAGSEAHGPSPMWDGFRRVKLPMLAGAESLNVAIASSVALYESIRQEIKGCDGA